MSAMKRANYIPAPHFFNLNMACTILQKAFCNGGGGVYLVGSSLERRDFRDVDVRLMLPDEEFDALFGEKLGAYYLNAKWAIMSSSISLYLSQHSGLPVDFQFQRTTEANRDYDGKRSALGLFYEVMK